MENYELAEMWKEVHRLEQMIRIAKGAFMDLYEEILPLLVEYEERKEQEEIAKQRASDAQNYNGNPEEWEFR